jgi:hypothetical protein
VHSVLPEPRDLDGVVRPINRYVVEHRDGLVREVRHHAVRGDDVAGGT